MPRLALLLPALLLINGCCTKAPQAVLAASTPPAEARLVELMAQRLEVSRAVAWIKFQNQIPVRDPKREAELLDSLVAQSTGTGLTSEAVREFFQAQILASCEVQRSMIRAWSRGATLPATAPQDLRRDIRPQLDRISAEMLRLLPSVRGPKNAALASYARSVIRQRGFSWRTADLATAPLR